MRRHPRFGVVHLAQLIVALIGNDDPRLLGVDGGIWEVGGVTQRAFGYGLEKGRFTDISQTDLSEQNPSVFNAMRSRAKARTCRTYDPALQVIARATQKDLLLLDFLLGRHSLLAGKSSKLVKGDENCRTGCLGGKRKLAKLRRERNTKIEAEHTHAGTCLVGIGGGVWGAIWLGAVVCKILTNAKSASISSRSEAGLARNIWTASGMRIAVGICPVLFPLESLEYSTYAMLKYSVCIITTSVRNLRH
jgi:hypothetical protein